MMRYAGDTLDPHLRHRMIGEAAYICTGGVGYATVALDNWLQAEAQIDHVAIGSRGDDARRIARACSRKRAGDRGVAAILAREHAGAQNTNDLIGELRIGDRGMALLTAVVSD